MTFTQQKQEECKCEKDGFQGAVWTGDCPLHNKDSIPTFTQRKQMDLRKVTGADRRSVTNHFRGMQKALVVTVLEGDGVEVAYHNKIYVFTQNGEFLGVCEEPTQLQSDVMTNKI